MLLYSLHKRRVVSTPPRPKLVLPPSPIEIAEQQFDPVKFYSDYLYIVPASNELGQSETVEVRVTPDHARLIAEIVQSGQSPYRRKTELVRWCIHNGLQQITKVLSDPRLLRSYTLLQAHMEQLSAEMRKVEMVRYTKRLAETVDAYLAIGAEDEARRIISEKATSARECGIDWITKGMLESLHKYDYLFEGGLSSVFATAGDHDSNDEEGEAL